ncbi:MAG: DUF3866 family protein [Bacillota bacterium]
MIRTRVGLVTGIRRERDSLREVNVSAEGEEVVAVNYCDLTGPVFPGDLVLLNNTAVYLGLGTGGVDFVSYNFSRPQPPFAGSGHIMKLRYTPWQMRVLACEEKAAGYQRQLAQFKGLQGMPVLIGELHSILAPAAAVIKHYRPAGRIVYLMTDGGALPIRFSRTAAELKEKELLAATVTCGHAFGGDLEAVNVYSGLVACRMILKADLVIICIGPGHVGTGTRYGYSGIEVGEHVNRVNALGGTAVVVPRISLADSRRRHLGISHHTLTALAEAALSAAHLVLPLSPRPQLYRLIAQLRHSGILHRHYLHLKKAPPVDRIMHRFGLNPAESMGRRYSDDPLYFQSIGAAALAAADLIQKKNDKGDTNRGESHGRDLILKLPLSRADRQCSPGPGLPAGREYSVPGDSRTSRSRGRTGFR